MSLAMRQLTSFLVKTFQKIAVEATNVKTSAILNEIVCYNQGAYIQYSYQAGELHKRFKEKVLKGKDATSERNELQSHLQNGLRKVIVENCKKAVVLYSSFKGRDRLPQVRVGLKVHEYDEKNKEQYISTLWGSPPYLDKNKCTVQSNSASRHIHTHGIWYHGYNIPSMMLAEDYSNSRIDVSRVLQYMSWKRRLVRLLALPYKFFTDSCDDVEWRKCWTANNKDIPDFRTCYKSTLVIPLTLKRNSLDQSFIDIVKEKGSRTSFFLPE